MKFNVKIVSGKKHSKEMQEHMIPANDENEARRWAEKQASACGIPEPLIMVNNVTEEPQEVKTT
jgi:hypothetical protein